MFSCFRYLLDKLSFVGIFFWQLHKSLGIILKGWVSIQVVYMEDFFKEHELHL